MKLLVTTVTENNPNAFYRPCRLLKHVSQWMTIGSLKRKLYYQAAGLVSYSELDRLFFFLFHLELQMREVMKRSANIRSEKPRIREERAKTGPVALITHEM